LGTLQRRRNAAIDLFTERGFDPLEAKIDFAEELRAALQANAFATGYEKLEHLRVYNDCLRDLLQ